MCMKGGDPYTSAQQLSVAQSKALDQGMAGIDQAYAGYTPDFYEKYRKSIIKAGIPTINREFQKGQNQLGFALANQGLQKSGAGMRLGDTLAQELTDSKMALSDRALSQEQALQMQVANFRNQQVAQLQSAVAPTQVAMSGLGGALGVQPPSALAPIAADLQNFGSQYLKANLALQNPQIAQPIGWAPSYPGGQGGWGGDVGSSSPITWTPAVPSGD